MFADLLVPSHDDMTKLHLFNPEHDIALAANLAHFTAPLAGRQLRADLAYLPALWADEDDYVLVEQVEQAQRGYESLRQLMNRPQAKFIHRHELSRLPIEQVEHQRGYLAIGLPAGALSPVVASSHLCTTVALAAYGGYGGRGRRVHNDRTGVCLRAALEEDSDQGALVVEWARGALCHSGGMDSQHHRATGQRDGGAPIRQRERLWYGV